MTTALIGHSGFVGTTLLKQRTFDALYRSVDIHECSGREFELVVCAAAPAQKWIANREPQADLQNINRLIEHLSTIRCSSFVLVSTVDVYARPIGVDEDTAIDEGELQPYGLHRRHLEKFVQSRFARHLVVRLPGLIGPGLRKNVVFDLLNGNNLHAVDSRGVFQFYPTVNLWFDLERALGAGLSLVNLTAEPISVAEVAEDGFGKALHSELPSQPARYDMRTRHGALFGGATHYQYSKREAVLAIRAYAQSEPRSAPWSAKT